MKKNLFKLSLVFVFFWLFWDVSMAKADGPVNIHLEIESVDGALYNDFISVSACPESPDSATTTINGFCAFAAAEINAEASWSSFGAFITSIGGVPNDAINSNYWLWFLDSEPGPTGINNFLLSDGDRILWTISQMPLKISASTVSPVDGATTTISVLQFDPVAFDWIPASGATVDFGFGTTTTDLNGQANITATSSTPFSVSASKANFLSSSILNITPRAAQANITIRNGAIVVFSGAVFLPDSNAVSADIAPTNASTTVAVPARGLLSILKTVDQAQDEFAITDLQYYSSFNSFFINCLTIRSEINPLCGFWQYNLNGVDPLYGVDQALLKNGDIVFLYFGNQRQVSLSTANATVGEPLTATAQRYNPADNAYMPITGVTIGLTQPNPNDAWNPLEIATSTVDANGQAIFILNAAGTYNAGIKEDFYFPLTALSVTAATPLPAAGGSVIIPPSGGSSVATAPKIDLNKAVDFLISKQNTDGSFGSALVTDWAAIALATVNPNGSAAQKVKNYLLTNPDPLVGMNPISDYARRAMALMSLNISPYQGAKTNYIKKIVDLFDGRQFGDASLYNDDIFALLVLSRAGYGAEDEMIKKTVDFIIAKQQANGSWNSVDLTAAAVQALVPVSALNGASAALIKARNFLVNAQGADGGFGDTYATSWAMQAITALGENSGNWQKNNNTPESYLVLSQGADGGLEKDNSYEINRIWSTAYAIPAVSNKAWFNILSSFAKENTVVIKNEPAGNSLLGTDLVATSTPEKSDLATSSPATASQTLDQASTTAVALTAEADNNKNKNIIKPAKSDIKTAMINLPVKSKKPLPLPVLPSKNELPKNELLETESPKAQDINNQADKTEEIVQAAPSPADSLAPEVKGAEEKPAEPNKINSKAKKVLYIAGAGTVLAGIVLILKFLGFLL